MRIKSSKTLLLLILFLSLGISLIAQAQDIPSSSKNDLARAPTQEPTVDTTYILEVLQISDDPLLSSTILVADKDTRKLFVFDPTKDITHPLQYEIDIGKNNGNKTRRDDHKTPEGIYLLETKKTQPEIPFDKYGSMAFTTNYPNVFDKFENKGGGGIWLHSVPDSVPLNRGSRGCVVVRNDKLKQLGDQIKLNKSYLIINNKLAMVSEKEHFDKKQFVQNWFNQWKEAWEKQDLDTYITYYSDNFTAPAKFNKKTWLKHKQRLKSLYNYVKVKVGNPHIFNQKNQYVLRFYQSYESDKHQDNGLKSLYLIEENGVLKVLREEWTKL